MATTGALEIFLPCAAHRKPGWLETAPEQALFSGALISLQHTQNSSLLLNRGFIKSSVLLSAKMQEELLILKKKAKIRLFPALSTLKILTFLPVCFSFSACGDNKNDSDAMKECSLACSDLHPEDKSDKITPGVMSSSLHQSFFKKYFISFSYILCLDLTGVWSPSFHPWSQHLQLLQMEGYHLARRPGSILSIWHKHPHFLFPQDLLSFSVAHTIVQHPRASSCLVLWIFHPPVKIIHKISTGYIYTVS